MGPHVAVNKLPGTDVNERTNERRHHVLCGGSIPFAIHIFSRGIERVNRFTYDNVVCLFCRFMLIVIFAGNAGKFIGGR